MKKKTAIGSRIYMLLANLFIFLPVFYIVRGAFNSDKKNIVWKGFTTQWFESMIENEALLESLTNTIILALAAMILSTIIGTLAAYGMYRIQFRGKKLLDMLFYVPIIIPEIVIGIALMIIFALVGIQTGMVTLIISHTTFCVPFVVFNVRTSLSGLDPSIEEASMDLGMNRVQTFFKVILPLIMPGVCAGAFMAFTLSVDDVIISTFTTGPTCTTLPLKIQELAKRGITPDVNALTCLILVLVIMVLLLSQIPWVKIFNRMRGNGYN